MEMAASLMGHEVGSAGADTQKESEVTMDLPNRVTLLSQTILVSAVPNLHVPSDGWVHEGDIPDDTHMHKAYGTYNEAEQSITLDDSLAFERIRESFLHENLHAMMAVTQLDSLLEAQSVGFEEHTVSSLAPVLLSWLRDNPQAVAFLSETQ